LLARNPQNYESIVTEIKASGGHAIGISTDVSSPQSVSNAFSEIQKEFKGKKLAAAIYNVGGRFVRKPFLEMTLDEYELGYESNGYVVSLSIGDVIWHNVSEHDADFACELVERPFTSLHRRCFLSYSTPWKAPHTPHL
jgi:NADP-dependent 3-hydroxy acid dehydrogenase YdfG